MTPTSQEISPGLVRPTRGADECEASGLGSRVKGRSMGIRLIERPMENSDDSELTTLKTQMKVPT